MRVPVLHQLHHNFLLALVHYYDMVIDDAENHWISEPLVSPDPIIRTYKRELGGDTGGSLRCLSQRVYRSKELSECKGGRKKYQGAYLDLI